MSQSPQAGQFNSYQKAQLREDIEFMVSIPSSGSIQFLPTSESRFNSSTLTRLNPLKRVNSILTKFNGDWAINCMRIVSIPSSGSIQFLRFTMMLLATFAILVSQSPQAGQFNSYSYFCFRPASYFKSQSPQAGQFNSYGIMAIEKIANTLLCLNPLKRVNSILTAVYWNPH